MKEKTILELYFVRHAQSCGNTDVSFEYNPDDPPLTDYGIKQARLLGERMSEGTLDAVYSSPLTRCIQTAYCIIERQSPSLPVILLPDLMEVDTRPGFEGCDAKRLRAEFPRAIPCTSVPSPTGGGLSLPREDFAASADRGRRVVNYIRENYRNGERVALVSHGGFFGFLFRPALSLPEEDFFRWSVNNSSVSKIRFYENGKAKLSFSNDTTHLFPLESELTYTI